MLYASITDPIVNLAVDVVREMGLVGVFLLMLGESACLPIPSEATMLFAGFNVAEGEYSLFLATFIVRNDAANAVVATICAAAGVYAAIKGFTTRNTVVRRIVLEMTGVILLTPLLDILAGGLLQAREPALAFVPALYLLIPPFVSQAGALGGILSSRLTSRLGGGRRRPR